jgi:hypothetical protein
MCRELHGAAYATFAAVERNKFEWSAGKAVVYLTMGTIDGNPDCPPGYHQFVGSKAPWHEITDDQPLHEAWPDA